MIQKQSYPQQQIPRCISGYPHTKQDMNRNAILQSPSQNNSMYQSQNIDQRLLSPQPTSMNQNYPQQINPQLNSPNVMKNLQMTQSQTAQFSSPTVQKNFQFTQQQVSQKKQFICPQQQQIPAHLSTPNLVKNFQLTQLQVNDKNNQKNPLINPQIYTQNGQITQLINKQNHTTQQKQSAPVINNKIYQNSPAQQFRGQNESSQLLRTPNQINKIDQNEKYGQNLISNPKTPLPIKKELQPSNTPDLEQQQKQIQQQIQQRNGFPKQEQQQQQILIKEKEMLKIEKKPKQDEIQKKIQMHIQNTKESLEKFEKKVNNYKQQTKQENKNVPNSPPVSEQLQKILQLQKQIEKQNELNQMLQKQKQYQQPEPGENKENEVIKQVQDQLPQQNILRQNNNSIFRGVNLRNREYGYNGMLAKIDENDEKLYSEFSSQNNSISLLSQDSRQDSDQKLPQKRKSKMVHNSLKMNATMNTQLLSQQSKISEYENKIKTQEEEIMNIQMQLKDQSKNLQNIKQEITKINDISDFNIDFSNQNPEEALKFIANAYKIQKQQIIQLTGLNTIQSLKNNYSIEKVGNKEDIQFWQIYQNLLYRQKKYDLIENKNNKFKIFMTNQNAEIQIQKITNESLQKIINVQNKKITNQENNIKDMSQEVKSLRDKMFNFQEDYRLQQKLYSPNEIFIKLQQYTEKLNEIQDKLQ